MNASVIQSMINAIDRPAIYITPDYVIQAVNQAYRDTYKTDVIIGNSKCHQISHRNDKPCDQCGEACPISRCYESQRATSVVHIHSTRTGKSYCDILMKPIFDEEKGIIGFLEILDRIEYASSESRKSLMIGISDAFKQLLNQINRSAQSEIAVLLQGETGAGKELVAKAVHDSSRRKDKPFVVIECTGLNESLFESELFGYEKGAFTGATNSKKGLIEVANGGTVFFDEIGDVPLNMQVKLLRLLETQTYRPVGGLKQKKADFRLVCASHKNLLKMVESGEFRQDLYYRIAGFPIHLPALRERNGDISHLAEHFLKHSEHNHKRFDQAALAKLSAYSFPGNVRELRNIVEQAALISNDDIITREDLPPQILSSHAQNLSTNALSKSANTLESQQPNSDGEITPANVVPLDQVEQEYLKNICATFTGSPDELANQLQISTRTLYRKLQRYGLKLIN